MDFMDNSEFIARALRDYLRPIAGENEVHHIDRLINVGESDAALMEAVGIAQHFKISLPPIFREKIAELVEMPMDLLPALLEDIDRLPAFWQQAS